MYPVRTHSMPVSRCNICFEPCQPCKPRCHNPFRLWSRMHMILPHFRWLYNYPEPKHRLVRHQYHLHNPIVLYTVVGSLGACRFYKIVLLDPIHRLEIRKLLYLLFYPHSNKNILQQHQIQNFLVRDRKHRGKHFFP